MVDLIKALVLFKISIITAVKIFMVRIIRIIMNFAIQAAKEEFESQMREFGIIKFSQNLSETQALEDHTMEAEIKKLKEENDKLKVLLDKEKMDRTLLQETLDETKQKTQNELEYLQKIYEKKVKEISDEIRSKYEIKIEETLQVTERYENQCKIAEKKIRDLQNILIDVD